ncbi:hypothetical protein GpartN1_g5046.t1 [Galdieria partita]|uniref:DNA/pantothenate metabolism flavoprotein C-terminal domain-containing protein n=1 Tax=Galdieria partita TaxID=83374 RepID=A0A9C7US53_9RHOD|nr:hypothetical protein GpartN1_g5046.t1 [Galdieria partita]
MEEKFFASCDNRIENYLQQQKTQLDTFLKTEAILSSENPIVVVTSGGTIAPLEKRVVRYIDNFSTGNRGARAAESFLEQHCYVVFLHREGSSCPYGRSFSKRCLDILHTWSIEGDHLSDNGQLIVPFLKLAKAIEQSRILFLTFQTVTEYLCALRQIALSLNPFGKKVIMFLAAAVSDFYVPESELPEHKISSSVLQGDEEDWQASQSYLLRLYHVPKCLGLLKSKWAPEAYVVAFKLETDANVLLEKAKKTIDQYGVDIVVANELTSRYEQVQLVTKQQTIVDRNTNDKTIEQVIVQNVLDLYQQDG